MLLILSDFSCKLTTKYVFRPLCFVSKTSRNVTFRPSVAPAWRFFTGCSLLCLSARRFSAFAERNVPPKRPQRGHRFGNRGYERSEHPRPAYKRGTCTLEECPIITRGRPLQGRSRCWLTSGGAAHTPVIERGDAFSVLVARLRRII